MRSFHIRESARGEERIRKTVLPLLAKIKRDSSQVGARGKAQNDGKVKAPSGREAYYVAFFLAGLFEKVIYIKRQGGKVCGAAFYKMFVFIYIKFQIPLTIFFIYSTILAYYMYAKLH